MCIGGIVFGFCCGQPRKNVTVPLIGASSKVTILDYVAQVELKQRYENQDDFPIEAVYEYPLPEGAAVTGFTIEIDGKVLRSKIQEKEKAKEIYDDAIAEGHGAYLMEQVTDNVFNTSVGNLPPNKEVIITIVYVQQLEFVDAATLEFVMPTTQYAPNGRNATACFTKSKSNTYENTVPYGVRVEASVQIKAGVKSMTSPSHVTEVAQGPTGATARIQQTDGAPLTKHWRLHVALERAYEPSARVQATETQSVAMLSFYPDLEESEVYSEIIFVVDRSGSMAGEKMRRVKETLDLFLRSLPEGTLFNIVSFGTKFSKQFETSVEYNEKTFAEATAHVQKMFANMGGTNIMEPLCAVLDQKMIDGVPRQIFLLTDGEVSNSDECIRAVKRHANLTRVFTFGIGHEADKKLITDMAKAGNGFYEVIVNNDDMEEKVMRQLSRALKPALTDLKVDWGTVPVLDQAPYHCPPLFSGAQAVFYATVPAKTTGTHKVTLTASSHTKKFTSSVDVNFDQKIDGDFVVKLAAKAMIRDFEEGKSYMHSEKGDRLVKHKPQEIDDKILELSLKHQVLSKLTAFVAVEKRREATIGTMQTTRFGEGAQTMFGGGYGGGPMLLNSAPPMPPLSSSGSIGLFRKSSIGGGAPPSFGFGSAPPPPSFSFGSAPPPPPGGAPLDSFSFLAAPDISMELSSSLSYGAPPSPRGSAPMQFLFQQQPSSTLSTSRSNSFSSPLQSVDFDGFAPDQSSVNFNALPATSALPRPAVSAQTKEDVRAIIQQQAFNGSFPLQTLVARAPKAKLDKIRDVLKQHNVPVSSQKDAAAVTLVIVLLFEVRFSELKSMWELVAKKAKTWAKKELGNIDTSAIESDLKAYLLTIV